MELVSVIMPAYNAAKFIDQAITSLINQTYQNWELVVIDDGSVDNTATIVKQLAAVDPRIKYHYQPNAKQGKARNAGVSKSSGKLIAFLDSDDLWLPDRLTFMVKAFEQDDQDLLFSDAYIFENGFNINRIPADQKKFMVKAAKYQGGEGLQQFLTYNKVPMLTTLLKKEVLIAAGMFSNRGICEDYELWLKLLIKGYKLRAVDLPLAAYRLHEHASTSDDKLAIDECIDVIFNLVKETESLPYKKLLLTGLKNWYLRKIDTIFTSVELARLLKKIRAQNGWHFKLAMVNMLNLNVGPVLRINKNLTKHSIKNLSWSLS